MKKIVTAMLLCALMLVTMLAGCATQAQDETASPPDTATPGASAENVSSQDEETAQKAKYIFLFIGDGMSHVQVNAAQVYLGDNISGEVSTKSLNFTQFPVSGVATTYDSTSFCPDSASTATALSCGVKTHSGVIGLEVDKQTQPESITEILKAQGMKIGIVSTVTINHATPAAFYSHIESRNEYYDIALQLAQSDFDYYGGGSVNKATGSEGDQTDAYGVIESNGYTIADTTEKIMALDGSSGKVYALSPVLQDSGSMPYAIDAQEGDLRLADYVAKGIDVLDNDDGFFMMCESGKIDWACHANDAMTTIQEVIDFESAVQVAVDFAALHPDETLILVTGDHETGGLTIGYAATGYSTAFDIMDHQKMSYVAFDELIGQMKQENPALTLDEVMPVIKDSFGLIAPDDEGAQEDDPMVLTEYEYAKLENAFTESMKPEEERDASEEAALLYGSYDPLSVTITHIINNKSGIGWTSYAHTGTPVAVFAKGAGADLFGGSYDNTDIFTKMLQAAGQ